LPIVYPVRYTTAAYEAKKEKEDEERVVQEAKDLLKLSRQSPAEQPIESQVYARLCRHGGAVQLECS
jgi:hypothetical protein